MESAIPQQLRRERTRHRRIPDDYAPPYPAFVARHSPTVKQVIMAYFGVQHEDADRAAADAALDDLAVVFGRDDGPAHSDRAAYVDEAGRTNVVAAAYWDEPAAFDRWFPGAREVWTGDGREGSPVGFFIEALRPSIEGYETLFSSIGRPEGIATLAPGLSADIQEHAYWGGMRDRIPMSQISDMAPAGEARAERIGSRIRVHGHDNLCLIRSGQDWSDMEAMERGLYLTDIEPVLKEGMDFLRDEGLSVGCFANRYMTQLGADARPVEKSFGMSWWKSLAALERWSESHPTHVAIFGAAMKYLVKFGPSAKLRLYHEVSVAKASEQFFEYRNCHQRTGMLGAVKL